MVTFYSVLLILGVVLWVVNVWASGGAADSAEDAARKGPRYEVGLPGSRAERSDEYIGGGGVGGAEGETAPPSFQAPADGGIGGAEGGEAAADLHGRREGSMALTMVARGLLGAGLIGLIIILFWPAEEELSKYIAGAGGILLGVAGMPFGPRKEPSPSTKRQ